MKMTATFEAREILTPKTGSVALRLKLRDAVTARASAVAAEGARIFVESNARDERRTLWLDDDKLNDPFVTVLFARASVRIDT